MRRLKFATQLTCGRAIDMWQQVDYGKEMTRSKKCRAFAGIRMFEFRT